MNKPINSPFRYPGGKFYARNLILNHIPSHSYYAEPFAGGGSIFFVKDKVNINWLNDIDELLINTLLISGITLIILYPLKVKTLLMSDNQQVTKRDKILVGTSETTRPLSSKCSNES